MMKLRLAGRRPKKKKRLNTVIDVASTSLITSSVIIGGTSIPAFASDVGMPIGAALGGLGVVLSLLTIAI